MVLDPRSTAADSVSRPQSTPRRRTARAADRNPQADPSPASTHHSLRLTPPPHTIMLRTRPILALQNLGRHSSRRELARAQPEPRRTEARDGRQKRRRGVVAKEAPVGRREGRQGSRASRGRKWRVGEQRRSRSSLAGSLLYMASLVEHRKVGKRLGPCGTRRMMCACHTRQRRRPEAAIGRRRPQRGCVVDMRHQGSAHVGGSTKKPSSEMSGV